MKTKPLMLLAFLASAVLAYPANYTTNELMQREASATVALLEKLHISKKAVAEIDPKDVLKTYCENLDPGKM